MIADKWPVTRSGQIHVKDPKHPMAILTCWTKKDRIIEMLEKAGVQYNSVGQLYSSRGLSPLFRNLLANKYIRKVVVVGKDLSGVQDDLHDFVDEALVWSKNRMNMQDIPDKKLDWIRKRVEFVMPCYTDDEETICALRNESNTEVLADSSMAEVFAEPEPTIRAFPAPDFGHSVIGRTIPEVYLKMLQYILRFGKETNTHYEDPQKEVLAMQNIITEQSPVWNFEEDELNLEIPEWMPEDSDHLETYIRERMLSGKHWPDLKYTYGELIHAFQYVDYHKGPFGASYSLDQMGAVVKKMVDDSDQRSCVISLWDPTEHSFQKSGTPCLNHIQFRMRDDVLTCHAFIRSNDMFAGWPENAYALRALQEQFVKRYLEAKGGACAVALGPLCITSMSAHIYRDSWEAAQELVDNHLAEVAKKPWRDFDPKGMFDIREGGDTEGLIVDLVADSGILQTFKGETAEQICHQIALANVTNNASNLMHLARELQKLEDKR